MQVTIEQTYQGAWQITCLWQGFLASRQHMGYSKQDALTLFSQEVLNGIECYA